MEKRHPVPGQPGRQAEQESFEHYSNPRGNELEPSDPKYDPQIEPQTQPEEEIQPVRDGQENKSPLRPIDSNLSPDDFRHSPLGHQQSGTHGVLHNSPTDGPVME